MYPEFDSDLSHLLHALRGLYGEEASDNVLRFCLTPGEVVSFFKHYSDYLDCFWRFIQSRESEYLFLSFLKKGTLQMKLMPEAIALSGFTLYKSEDALKEAPRPKAETLTTSQADQYTIADRFQPFFVTDYILGSRETFVGLRGVNGY